MTLREELDQFAEWIQSNEDTELFIDQLDEIERICRKHLDEAGKPGNPSVIDLIELKRALHTMQPRQQLYELIKAEMKRRGRWKNLDRGAKPPKDRLKPGDN